MALPRGRARRNAISSRSGTHLCDTRSRLRAEPAPPVAHKGTRHLVLRGATGSTLKAQASSRTSSDLPGVLKRRVTDWRQARPSDPSGDVRARQAAIAAICTRHVPTMAYKLRPNNDSSHPKRSRGPTISTAHREDRRLLRLSSSITTLVGNPVRAMSRANVHLEGRLCLRQREEGRPADSRSSLGRPSPMSASRAREKGLARSSPAVSANSAAGARDASI
jgi:hypothetical protein